MNFPKLSRALSDLSLTITIQTQFMQASKQPLMMAYEGSESAGDKFGKFIF